MDKLLRAPASKDDHYHSQRLEILNLANCKAEEDQPKPHKLTLAGDDNTGSISGTNGIIQLSQIPDILGEKIIALEDQKKATNCL